MPGANNTPVLHYAVFGAETCPIISLLSKLCDNVRLGLSPSSDARNSAFINYRFDKVRLTSSAFSWRYAPEVVRNIQLVNSHRVDSCLRSYTNARMALLFLTFSLVNISEK